MPSACRRGIIYIGEARRWPVAALSAPMSHARRQVRGRVRYLVVHCTEAGGHCGEVSTMGCARSDQCDQAISATCRCFGRAHHDRRQMAAVHGDGRGRLHGPARCGLPRRIREHLNLPREDYRGSLARRWSAPGAATSPAHSCGSVWRPAPGTAWPDAPAAADSIQSIISPRRPSLYRSAAAAGNARLATSSAILSARCGLSDSVKSAAP